MKAESEGKGLGSTFTVELPTGKKQIPATLHGDSPNQIPRLSGTRVLVVDDLPDALDLVSEILLLAGAVVQTARSADEALEQMQIFRPHVLVSDIGLPTMDGHELIRHIRRLPADNGGKRQPLRSRPMPLPRTSTCIASGFQVHVSKPVDPNTLWRAVVQLAR